MEINLDGNDWQLIFLYPFEWNSRKVWLPDWNPQSPPQYAGQWIKGTVPGDVISDALDAELIPHPYKDLNTRTCEWLSERDWVYRKYFKLTEEYKNKNIRLHFEGVDYSCHIYLNGELLGEHEGMFTPFEFDISRNVKFDEPNCLVVVVDHAPEVDIVQGQTGWTKKARIWKARFAYTWDWTARLVPVGIWKSVRVIVTDVVYLKDIWSRQEIDFKKNIAKLKIITSLHSSSKNPKDWKLKFTLQNPHGEKIHEDFKSIGEWKNKDKESDLIIHLEYQIHKPDYWYPNGMGNQPLYQLKVQVLNPESEISDDKSLSIGIRQIKIIPNEVASPEALPYTLEVNGQKMFAKGWNWVPIDNMYGRVQNERYEWLLTLAKHAHCNLLRVWGGGLLEREEFYDFCDRMGILVWQEFLQSSSGIQNAPPEDGEYLHYIEEQARQMVPLRRNHPSLAIWCGGNELMDDSLKPLDNETPAIKALKKVVDELDPDRIWLPTSASGPVECPSLELTGTGKMHDVHGTWWYQGPEEHYKFYNGIDPLFHSECGVEGAANFEILKEFISPEFHFPPDETNPIWIHHGNWWIHREKLEKLFGRFDDIQSFIKASQFIHAEGLRYIVESNRRRKWHTSGVCPWQFNEPFPNTTCSNVVDYLGLPKPAYWWIRRAYEPIHISLKYEKIQFKPGELFQGEIWINNSNDDLDSTHIVCFMSANQGETIFDYEDIIDLKGNSSQKIHSFKLQLPTEPNIYFLQLCLYNKDGNLLSNNEYFFSTQEPLLKSLLTFPEIKLNIELNSKWLKILNPSKNPALFVQIYPKDNQKLLLSDNYFSLSSKEDREIEIIGSGNISIKAWNSPIYDLLIS